MAIVGYEQDQVMVSPRGAPGQNPEQDVSVPINWAYNHHYMAWMTGADSEIIMAENNKGDGYGMGWHGRTHHMEARDLPSAKSNGAPGMPTSQMFSEGNGGESRKSFHGFPKGYAQLIHSPNAWHITPMQIDTRNRDCGVNQTDIAKCPQFTPGIEPKQARYGRGIPVGGTNYSGVLECPCNSNYAGDPEFYGKATLTKQITHHYSAIAEGTCSGNDKLFSAAECFANAPLMGFNATKFVNATVNSAAAPFGCSVTTDGKGTATATWNAAGAAPCGASATKVGQTVSLIQTTVAVELTPDGKDATMARSAKGLYCKSNGIKSNILTKFNAATSTDPAADAAALAKCEAYCLANAACNFCSVDQETPRNGKMSNWWVALKACGAETKFSGAIPGDISSKVSGGEATITLSGPAEGWFAVGFNAQVMSDSPYTLMANSTDVWEQHLGTCGSEAEHCPGDLLASSIKVVSKSVVDGVRTVVVTRPFVGKTKVRVAANNSRCPFTI